MRVYFDVYGTSVLKSQVPDMRVGDMIVYSKVSYGEVVGCGAKIVCWVKDEGDHWRIACEDIEDGEMI